MKRLLVAALVVGGCDGSILGLPAGGLGNPSGISPQRPGSTQDLTNPQDPSNQGTETLASMSACTGVTTPGSAPMRRLSQEEYEHVVEDLFGDATLARQVANTFITDSVSLGFRNGARFLDVKPVMMQKYQDAAELIASQVTSAANLTKLVSCPTTQGETCARASIEKLLLKATRRPPSTGDVDRYVAIWRTGSTGADFRTGMEWVVGALLQAPRFLYRLEVDQDNGAQRPLSPYELASRLSFFLWQSSPDDALFEAARTGALSTAADVEREARRMLADPKADRIFNFFEQWMDVDEVSPLKRDANVFPGLPATLAELLREETHQFVRATVLEGDGSFDSLMTSPVTFMNGDLARHYGVSSITGASWQRYTFSSGKRGGLFMSTAALVSHDKQTRTSIVNRGMRVRTQLLCQTVPAPPDNVPLNLQPIDAQFSQADRLEQHRNNPSCNGCHTLLDPLGEPFEHLNAVGLERTVDEGNRPVKTAGRVFGTRDFDGPVNDGLDLMKKLSASEEARECMVTQLFRFSHGRQEERPDLCSRQRVFDRFKTSGWNVRELFVALTQTDDFLFRPGVAP